MAFIERNCDNCNKNYLADTRNLNRGWGLCCSKSCAASKREKSRPDYDPEVVARNNRIRSGKLIDSDYQYLTDSQKFHINKNRYDMEAPNIVGGSGIITGITSEGYRVMDGTAYDEWDDPVYNIDSFDDTHPFDLDN